MTHTDIFIKKSREEYYGIGHVNCPAFDEERVYFNRHGWNHLIRKGKKLRSVEERLRRIKLIKYAPQIISIVRHIADHRENIDPNNSHHYFWTIYQKIANQKIRIVIRQRNNGKKHFFSIMKEK